MRNIFLKIKSIIGQLLLSSALAFLWLILSGKRRFSVKKRFGLLSEEFFAKNFLDDKLCDIGGFAVTAQVISQYYSDKQNRDFEITALFNRTLDKQGGWRSEINGSTVFTIPDLKQGYIKGLLAYSFQTQKIFDFLLSIDLYPGYEFSLKAMPHTPLLIWLRDPQGAVELRRIGTVGLEMRAKEKSTMDDFITFAEEKRDFFLKVFKQSKTAKRPVIFATNAQYLAPRAQRLYNLKELNPYFLPNPIHYPPIGRIQKSQQPTVCLLGRLDPVKRPWIYFELARKFKNVEFLVCGQPSYPNLGIMNPIIDQYRSVENLKFLGLVEGENKANILSRSWLLVNTSIHEGLPCSFLESFAYGTPIVSSVNPDDWVSKFGFYTGENTGDGTDEHTMKKFQEGLDKFLSDKKEMERVGLEARGHIEKIYNFDVFEINLKNILADQFKPNYTL